MALLEEGKQQAKANDDIMGRVTPHSTLAGMRGSLPPTTGVAAEVGWEAGRGSLGQAHMLIDTHTHTQMS